MRSNSLHITLFLLAILILVSSCSVIKFIPEGKFLSTKGEVVLKNKEASNNSAELSNQLSAILRPIPNKRLLGGYPGVYFYFKNQNKKPGFFNRFMYKKFGEEPVFSNEVKPNSIRELLLNRLQNKGYFYCNVNIDIENKDKKKESKVVYTVRLEKPYTMARLQLDSMPEPLYSDIKISMNESLLKIGQRFDLALLNAERNRIDAFLKTKGYYNFNGGFLIFNADTNQYNDRQFALYLGLKKDVLYKSTIPYKVAEINIYPSVGIVSDSFENHISTIDGIKYIHDEDFFRSDRLAPFITLTPRQHYNTMTSRATARRLLTIGIYRFINIQYEMLEGNSIGSDGKLQARIELSPLNKRAVSAEIQAVSKSNNFAGPTLLVTHTNRNLWKGGERFSISGQLGYEFQIANKGSSNYNLNLGLKGELIVPRLMLPFRVNNNFFKYDIPRTKMALSIEHSDRNSLYKLISATASFGYTWNANRFVSHELSLVSINYNNLYQSSPEFDDQLNNNPFLKQSFDQEFIAGIIYSFTYNELLDPKLKNAFFFNSNLDLAGNILSSIDRKGSDQGSYTVLGLQYAQYAKMDMDFRYHIRVRKDKTIIARVFGGYGLPYGNSSIMPFNKQYYSGGPYGLRAFGIRAIGPGTFEGTNGNNTSLFEQTGNIKLEGNLEYRFPLFSYLKGAVFTDVGNVWLSEENPDLPGGTLSSSIVNELGMGAGFGLRIDVQGFVLRFDFAAPFHVPATANTQHYSLELNKTKFNFAIGYPF